MNPVIAAALCAVFGILIFATIQSHNTNPPKPADQWANVYRTCVGSYPTDQQRAACIAAADRVVVCAGQKEVKP